MFCFVFCNCLCFFGSCNWSSSLWAASAFVFFMLSNLLMHAKLLFPFLFTFEFLPFSRHLNIKLTVDPSEVKIRIGWNVTEKIFAVNSSNNYSGRRLDSNISFVT